MWKVSGFISKKTEWTLRLLCGNKWYNTALRRSYYYLRFGWFGSFPGDVFSSISNIRRSDVRRFARKLVLAHPGVPGTGSVRFFFIENRFFLWKRLPLLPAVIKDGRWSGRIFVASASPMPSTEKKWTRHPSPLLGPQSRFGDNRGKTTRNLSGLPPKRDCSSRRGWGGGACDTN